MDKAAATNILIITIFIALIAGLFLFIPEYFSPEQTAINQPPAINEINNKASSMAG